MYIRFFNEIDKNCGELVGGKGANLGELTSNGINVPNGFCIITNAYKLFVKKSSIEDKIQKTLNNTNKMDLNELESASIKIRNLFLKKVIISEIKDEVADAYKKLTNFKNNIFVAVRSSATFEDLPDMSFAGQQDTFLNISSFEGLLSSIIMCWSSLWTARAISYRNKHNIDENDISLSVVVQIMVDSIVSGVMFTANPLSGSRNQVIIDSIFGLGESLVSGITEPDNYIFDKETDKIIKRFIGKKEQIIIANNSGGTVSKKVDNNISESLSDEMVIKLASLGKKIESIYLFPQDIEWAIYNEEIFILQSRPITSLFPIPNEIITKYDEPKMWFSFASVQEVMEPFSTFGRQVFSFFVVGIAKSFGINFTCKNQSVFASAADRIYINFTSIIKSQVRNKVLPFFIENIDPVLKDVFSILIQDEKWEKKFKISFSRKMYIARFFSKIFLRVAKILINPVKGRENINLFMNNLVLDTKKKIENGNNLLEKVKIINDSLYKVPKNFVKIVPCVVAGQIPYQIIKKCAVKMKN